MAWRWHRGINGQLPQQENGVPGGDGASCGARLANHIEQESLEAYDPADRWQRLGPGRLILGNPQRIMKKTKVAPAIRHLAKSVGRMLKDVQPRFLETVQPLHEAKISLEECATGLPIISPKHRLKR
jgi:hypothetical protein